MGAINIQIKKKDLFLVSAIVVFLVGVGIVVAGSFVGPSGIGHDFDELEAVQRRIENGLSACSGDNLAIKTIDPDTGEVTCESDDGAGSLSCSNAYRRCGDEDCDVACSSGSVTGGGGFCSGGEIIRSMPSGNGWTIDCAGSVSFSEVYAVCCSMS